MRKSVVSFGFAAFVLTQAMACACSCVSDDVEREFAAATAVFTGRPEEVRFKEIPRGGSMDSFNYYMEVVFRVETSWKGLEENVASVLTPVSDGVCGYWPEEFDPSSTYLIYARRPFLVPSLIGLPVNKLTSSPLPLETTICTRTGVVDGPATEDNRVKVDFRPPAVTLQDIKILGKGSKPMPSGDANRDGGLKLEDVQLALRASIGNVVLPTEGRIAGDLNGSGKIDLGDAILILRKFVGWGA